MEAAGLLGTHSCGPFTRDWFYSPTATVVHSLFSVWTIYGFSVKLQSLNCCILFDRSNTSSVTVVKLNHNYYNLDLVEGGIITHIVIICRLLIWIGG